MSARGIVATPLAVGVAAFLSACAGDAPSPEAFPGVSVVGQLGSAPAYDVALSAEALEAASDDPMALAEAVWAQTEKRIAQDKLAGALLGGEALVRVAFPSQPAVSPDYRAAALAEVGRRARASKEPQIAPLDLTVSATLDPAARLAQSVRALPLQPADGALLDAGRRVAQQVAATAPRGAPPLAGSDLADALAAEGVAAASAGDAARLDRAVVALGTWIGDRLVAEGGLEWATTYDGAVRDVGVVRRGANGAPRSYVWPFAVVQKRFTEGALFAPRSLTDALLDTLRLADARAAR